MEYFCQSLALGLARIPLVFLRGFCSSQHINIFPTFAEYGTNKKQKRLLRSKTTNSHILTCVEPRSSLDVEASRPLAGVQGLLRARRGASRHIEASRLHPLRNIAWYHPQMASRHRALASRRRGPASRLDVEASRPGLSTDRSVALCDP